MTDNERIVVNQITMEALRASRNVGDGSKTLGEILDEAGIDIWANGAAAWAVGVPGKEFATVSAPVLPEILRVLQDALYPQSIDAEGILFNIERTFLFPKCPECGSPAIRKEEWIPSCYTTYADGTKSSPVDEPEVPIDESYYCPECGMYFARRGREANGDWRYDDTGLFCGTDSYTASL
jgi:predicted RNA-binding Zn-ribbon protein involved in translation (DUF1610 family)